MLGFTWLAWHFAHGLSINECEFAATPDPVISLLGSSQPMAASRALTIGCSGSKTPVSYDLTPPELEETRPIFTPLTPQKNQAPKWEWTLARVTSP